jgi:hypothetical protein
MNYQIHLINHFWKMMRRRRVLITFGIFSKAKFQGFLLISTNSNLSLLESQHPALGGYPALHQQSTREKSGIDLILGIIPHLLQSDFDLLFLADLIHVFRICSTVCKGYKCLHFDIKQGSTLNTMMLPL